MFWYFVFLWLTCLVPISHCKSHMTLVVLVSKLGVSEWYQKLNEIGNTVPSTSETVYMSNSLDTSWGGGSLGDKQISQFVGINQLVHSWVDRTDLQCRPWYGSARPASDVPLRCMYCGHGQPTDPSLLDPPYLYSILYTVSIQTLPFDGHLIGWTPAYKDMTNDAGI